MVIGAVLIIVSDPDVLATYAYFTARPGRRARRRAGTWSARRTPNLFKGAIVDPEAVAGWLNGTDSWQLVFFPISETLTYAAPLVFTGLSVALAFRGGLFNIGAQGQAIIGVILAALAGFLLPLPPVLHLLVALLAGALGGALWGFIPGILKARTGAHEVITTIMLNYIARAASWPGSSCRTGVQDPDRTDAISKPVDASARSCPGCSATTCGCTSASCWPCWPPAAVAWLLNRSTFGFELRAVGANPDAARTAGISVARTYVAGHGRRRRAGRPRRRDAWCSAPAPTR